MNPCFIRPVREEDAAVLLAVYRPYVERSAVSMEYTAPDLSEFLRRIREIRTAYPYLVCISEGLIAGYAYAHRYLERAAYQWSAETTIYLREDCRGRGLGRKLYECLIELLKLQHISNLYGCITSSNAASKKFHEALGFVKIGDFHRCAYKFGAWHDVAWFEKRLDPDGEGPLPFLPFPEADSDLVSAVFSKYNG